MQLASIQNSDVNLYTKLCCLTYMSIQFPLLQDPCPPNPVVWNPSISLFGPTKSMLCFCVLQQHGTSKQKSRVIMRLISSISLHSRTMSLFFLFINFKHGQSCVLFNLCTLWFGRGKATTSIHLRP